MIGGRPRGGPGVIGAELSAEPASPSVAPSWRMPMRPTQENAERFSAGSNIGAVCWPVVRPLRHG